MTEKIYHIENLDCANCAAKAEAKIRQVPGVEAADITFATMQLRLRAEDPDGLLPQVLAAARTVEPDIHFVSESHPHCHHHECSCGHHHDHEHHDHEHHHHHEHEHDHGEEAGELPRLLVGAGLFAAGLLLQWLVPSKIPGAVAFLAAYVLLGWEVVKTALRNLIRGRIMDENFLMSVATLGAFALGDFAEGVGVMLFYRVGEYFEHKAMARSRAQIMEAIDLRPEEVTRLVGEETETIPAEAARVGDLLVVRPGDRIPLDGVVVSGESRIDTAPITGEPVPVRVVAGDNVVSGCINTAGRLVIRAEKPLSESMVSRILRSVENAAAGKPKMDRFVTRFARVYTPVVVAAAVLTAVVPGLITGDWNYWVYTALSFLVMSCPCALVLSVPLAFFSGIGVGGKQGILFKSGLSMEAMSAVKAVVMDKTGTLTKGVFAVQDAPEALLALCAACESNSTHPIARSIVAAAQARGLELKQPESQEEFPGQGIRAVLEGEEILCGNEKLLQRFGVELAESLPADGASRVLVAKNGRYAGCLTVSDELKPGAKETVAKLKKMGLYPAMLTGDRRESAEATGCQVGISCIHSQLLPEEKLQRLQEIRAQQGAVMFVGDGINDAPVLAGADVGAAMGSGADAALEAADVVFMTSDVGAVVQSLQIARDTRRIAWQNVIFALAIKAAVMVLGLLGMASMWAAVFADSGVAMLCVLNSVRLLYRKNG